MMALRAGLAIIGKAALVLVSPYVVALILFGPGEFSDWGDVFSLAMFASPAQVIGIVAVFAARDYGSTRPFAWGTAFAACSFALILLWLYSTAD